MIRSWIQKRADLDFHAFLSKETWLYTVLRRNHTRIQETLGSLANYYPSILLVQYTSKKNYIYKFY